MIPRKLAFSIVCVAASVVAMAACKNPLKQTDCPAGTKWDGAKCVANVDTSCPPGMRFEANKGCVANVAPSASAAVVPRPSASASSAPPAASAAAAGMVRIPAGDFQMGAADIEWSKPVHPAHVESFEMDPKEVTVAEYAACVAAKSCPPAITNGIGCNGDKKNRADHPTNCVNFERAEAYCKWAGKRLPTEEEWEYAARGTDGRKYPWGNEPPNKRACWDHGGGTCPVGSYPNGVSPFGLHDMIGNVAEWTTSFYSEGYDKPREKTVRVVRGGAWYAAHTAFDQVDTGSARAENRWQAEPSKPDYRCGIRCAR